MAYKLIEAGKSEDLLQVHNKGSLSLPITSKESHILQQLFDPLLMLYFTLGLKVIEFFCNRLIIFTEENVLQNVVFEKDLKD